jgi:hypothetical protein
MRTRTFPQIGVPEPYHSVSHHGNNPGIIAKIDTYHATLFACVSEKLRSASDGDEILRK